MTFCRYGSAAWLSLAASLGIHGIVLGGLALSGQPFFPDLSGGNVAPGAGASGGVLTVHLFEVPAAPGQSVADVSTAQAATRPIQLAAARAVDLPKRVERPRNPTTPAPAIGAAPREHPAPRTRPPASPRPQPAHSVAVARGGAPASEPLLRPVAAAGSAALRPTLGTPSRASGPGGEPLASAGFGSGNGYGTGPLDRVAKPAGSILPHYPPRARQRGEEADVTVEVWVGAQGDVDQVAVSRSAGTEFDAAAIEAVQRARFYPALRDGERVPSRVALLLHFRLER